ncbi:MAG: methylcrotonoyl-CoA carboxylase, partial [Nevskiales bacterium]
NTLADVKVRQLKRQGQDLTPEQIEEIRQPVLAEFKRKSSAYWSTSEIWDDGILDPVDTRNALGMAISAALNTPIKDPSYGIFRL